MAYSKSRSLFKAYALVILALLTFVSAQQCWTPAGTPTQTSDIPCGNGSNACCPDGWLCTDIGLCYNNDIPNNPFDDRFERKTCTKQSWGSSCPNNYCTGSGGKSGGNEVVRWCPDQSKWCCAGNGKVDCCTNGDNPGSLIDIKDFVKSSWAPKGNEPVQSATSSAAASTSGTSTTNPGTSSTSQPTSSEILSASSEPPSASSKSSSAASQSSSAVSQSSGPPETVVLTRTASGSTITMTTTSSREASSTSANTVYKDNPTASKKPSGSLGMIVGLAVGVPLVLLALGLLGFACWRRRRNNKRDSDISSVHPFYSGQPPAEKVLEIPDRGPPPVSEAEGPAEMQGSESYTQRYPVKPNPFQNRPDLMQPPEHNEAWSRETTMTSLPGAVNSGGHENVSPDTGGFSPPYSPVSSQSAGHRPNSYSEFSPNFPQGPWGQGQVQEGGVRPIEMEGSVRPVEMEGSRISTIAELPAGMPPGNQGQ